MTSKKITAIVNENIETKLIEAVETLNTQNVWEENIIIAFSPFTEMYLLKLFNEVNRYYYPQEISGKMDRFMGCKIYTNHPNNGEIVVYDKTDILRERKIVIPFEIALK